MDGDVRGECSLFDGGEANFLAAVTGAVRLSDDSGDFKVALGEEMFEAVSGESESGTAAENEA
jgi:hypothetical protein